MSSVTYLRPAMGPIQAERLLADVEAAVAEGRDLGDRRDFIHDITAALHVQLAHLLDVIEGLRAQPPSPDPILAAQLKRLNEACSGLHTGFSLMVRKANELVSE